MNYYKYNNSKDNNPSLKSKISSYKKIPLVYKKLIDVYGKQGWWPSNSHYETMIGAILTQNTTWTNVEKSIKNLKTVLDPELILSLSDEILINYIKPSGFYNQKSKTIISLTLWLKNYSFDIDKIKKEDHLKLRKELLDIKGIGKETADCILTYVLDKPYFVIDTYTRRLFSRLGLEIPKDYDKFRLLIENWVDRDLELYKEYHSLIIEHCKIFCKKTPKCQGCILLKLCECGKEITKGSL